MKNIGWFRVVKGHSRSSAMPPPFCRVHRTSYSTLTEIMRLSCTVSDIWRAICQKSPILPALPAFGTLVGGDPI